jgi:hypothetical protein
LPFFSALPACGAARPSPCSSGHVRSMAAPASAIVLAEDRGDLAPRGRRRSACSGCTECPG